MNRVPSNIRKEYKKSKLIESEINFNPLIQFKLWFEEALKSNVAQPNAMVLSTIKGQKPVSRIVLLKEIEDYGYVFYSNYNSSKAKDIRKNPCASLLFWWEILERQVRIEGKIEKVSQEQSISYFKTRPRESQLGAWASNQSEPISGRQELDNIKYNLEKKFKNKNVTKPENWGGFRLIPERFEFWQGRENRMHDRMTYLKLNGDWEINRLAP